jgi:hypothetical protein
MNGVFRAEIRHAIEWVDFMNQVTNESWGSAMMHGNVRGRRNRLNMDQRSEHQWHADVNSRERNGASLSAQTIEKCRLLLASSAAKPDDMNPFPMQLPRNGIKHPIIDLQHVRVIPSRREGIVQSQPLTSLPTAFVMEFGIEATFRQGLPETCLNLIGKLTWVDDNVERRSHVGVCEPIPIQWQVRTNS